MPLTIGQTFAPEPPGEVLGSVLATPLYRGFGGMWAIWTDPAGTEWNLSDIGPDHGFFTTNAVAGAGATPIEIVTDPLSRGGVEVRFIRSNPRRLTWPLYVWGDSHAEFLTRHRNLRSAFTATSHLNAPGRLTVYRYDENGVITEGRWIEAWYEEGFEGEGGQGHSSASPVLNLMCPDGFWRDITPVELILDYRPGRPFLQPYPTIAQAGIDGSFSFFNAGDVDAWPVWEITGPMTALTATNTTLGGAKFSLSYGLTAGQSATIDLSKPNRPLLRNDVGENLTGFLDWPGANLWPMRRGENRVDIRMAGAGSGSLIRLSFLPRYDGD